MDDLEKLIEASDRAQRWREFYNSAGFKEAMAASDANLCANINSLTHEQVDEFRWFRSMREGLENFKNFVESVIDDGDRAAVEIKTGKPVKRKGAIAT